MARARNIKPALFKNELLGVEDPHVTILFLGLWCLADRKGRLEDRPLRIKAEVFPYREGLDINGYLTVMEQLGFIQRYEIDGLKLIQIINFSKHQRPHNTEKDSELPERPENYSSQENNVKSTLSNAENTSRDVLIPDTGYLIPDTGSTDSLNTEEPILPDPQADADVDVFDNVSKKITKAQAMRVVDVYSQYLPTLQQVAPSLFIDSDRHKNLASRWAQNAIFRTEEFWRGFFLTVTENPHWMGENDRNWKADFGWLVKKTNFAKVCELGGFDQ